MSAHPDAPRIIQANDVASIVIQQATEHAPGLFITLDFRYGIADALWAAGYRKVDGEVEAQRIVADEWASAANEWSHQAESLTTELEKERRYSAKVDAAFAALKRQHATADVALVDAKAIQQTPNPAECDHEFTDHCVFCGVDAHEWFNHYAEGSQP